MIILSVVIAVLTVLVVWLASIIGKGQPEVRPVQPRRDECKVCQHYRKEWISDSVEAKINASALRAAEFALAYRERREQELLDRVAYHKKKSSDARRALWLMEKESTREQAEEMAAK